MREARPGYKLVPCTSTELGCAARRIHFERPDEPRGKQYVEVPESHDELMPAFCSWECAMYAGFMTMKYDAPECSHCKVAHTRWVCVM